MISNKKVSPNFTDDEIQIGVIGQIDNHQKVSLTPNSEIVLAGSLLTGQVVYLRAAAPSYITHTGDYTGTFSKHSFNTSGYISSVDYSKLTTDIQKLSGSFNDSYIVSPQAYKLIKSRYGINYDAPPRSFEDQIKDAKTDYEHAKKYYDLAKRKNDNIGIKYYKSKIKTSKEKLNRLELQYKKQQNPQQNTKKSSNISAALKHKFKGK